MLVIARTNNTIFFYGPEGRILLGCKPILRSGVHGRAYMQTVAEVAASRNRSLRYHSLNSGNVTFAASAASPAGPLAGTDDPQPMSLGFLKLTDVTAKVLS